MTVSEPAVVHELPWILNVEIVHSLSVYPACSQLCSTRLAQLQSQEQMMKCGRNSKKRHNLNPILSFCS